ncbi:hypothetical protein AVEN_182330-1 [Araneus ventricosus]|uniref:Uncharacterized protein n=1 Tax=Araneus ventricosus TaxID=182803 RepID=A0A4Y2KCY8_ARAVE|nr:hypothetical protein AVEN_182330-1 [Araneus ventricosus]
MDFVEMADIHHPNCTAARNPQQGGDPQLRDIEGADTLYLTPEAFRATEAIEFIAEHLRSEDEYIQVRLNFISFCRSEVPNLWYACPWGKANLRSDTRKHQRECSPLDFLVYFPKKVLFPFLPRG